MNFNLDEYKKLGYTVQKNFLNKEELKSLNDEIDRIIKGNTVKRHNKFALEMEPNQKENGVLVRRIYAPCQHYKSFKDISISNKLLDKIEVLIGENIILHYSKLNMKPSEIGTKIKWHQDYPFYPLTNTKSVTLLIYLDDANKENGCLKVIPKKESQKIYNHAEDGFFTGSVNNVNTNNEVFIEGSAGTTVFMDCLTLHSSAKNTSNKGRRTLIIGYRNTSAIPLYYGEMTNMMERESKLVRGENNLIANFDLTLCNVKIPLYKDKISSIYNLQNKKNDEK